ncbi:unnamed protein product, partial [Brassica oleracea var. botrytis]
LRVTTDFSDKIDSDGALVGESTGNKPEQDPVRRDSAETIEGDESATIYTALDFRKLNNEKKLIEYQSKRSISNQPRGN